MGLGDVYLEILEPSLEGSMVTSPTNADDSHLEILDGLRVIGSSVNLTEAVEFTDFRGPKGDPGSGGSGGGGETFAYRQNTPASQWFISHNLGVYTEPLILLDAEPTTPVWTDVEIADANNLTLTFPSPVSGWAYINR